MKCRYCSKPVEPEEVVKYLLYRNGSQLARKEKEYCSERCASYDQMGPTGEIGKSRAGCMSGAPYKVTPENYLKTKSSPNGRFLCPGILHQKRISHGIFLCGEGWAQKSGKDAVIWFTAKSESPCQPAARC